MVVILGTGFMMPCYRLSSTAQPWSEYRDYWQHIYVFTSVDTNNMEFCDKFQCYCQTLLPNYTSVTYIIPETLEAHTQSFRPLRLLIWIPLKACMCCFVFLLVMFAHHTPPQCDAVWDIVVRNVHWFVPAVSCPCDVCITFWNTCEKFNFIIHTQMSLALNK